MKQVMLRLAAALLGFIVGIVPAGFWQLLRSAPSDLDRGDYPNVYIGESLAQSDLRRQVAEARQRGERHLSVISLSCGMEANDLRSALAHYTVVIARPVERRTYETEWGLRSWHRFQVVETLSARPPFGYAWLPAPPAGMLPLGADEFLIPVTGGTMVIEGVTVEHRDSSDPHYSAAQTYLLFLNLNAESRVAYAPWPGGSGILTVSEDGTFSAGAGVASDLKAQLRRRFGNSVDRLRQHFRR